jgi:protein-disulfide isomerase
MVIKIDNINSLDLTANLNKSNKIFYKRWWFWVLILIVLIFIWLGVSIFYAYQAAQKNLSDKSNQNTTISDYELIYTADDPNLGNPQARIQIVEFSDFQCPYCAESHTIMRELLDKYPNDFYYIYRDFPLDDIHPQARLAAQAATCAHQQQKFWSFHDLLFQNQTKLELGNLLNYAQQVGLDTNKFTECLESGSYQAEVKKDQSDGLAAGVSATPTFFVNGEKVEGVVPLDSWEKILNIYIR